MTIGTRKIVLLMTAILAMLSCSTPPNNDGKLQGEIARKLNGDAELTKVFVIVNDGVANLSGEVSGESAKSKAASLAKIEGVREVRSDIKVLSPTPAPVPVSEATVETENSAQINDPPTESWEERAYNFIHNEYLKNRLVQCGDSYFVLRGKTSLYQTKTEIQIEISGKVIPADVLSEADKLNNKKPLPERWKGWLRMRVLGPWRSYGGTNWNAWRDDGADPRAATVEYTPDGKWSVYEGYYGDEPIYEKIGEYKCVGNDIDVLSIPDGPVKK